MAVADYKDLIAWQKAMDLVVEVYRLTQAFPAEERFGLTNQIRRAAVSVPSNIAEGQARGAGRDFAHFLRIANGSRQEVETQMEIAVRLGYIDALQAAPFNDRVQEVGRILRGLAASV